MISNATGGQRRGARILIVDDHPVVRDGLAAQITTQRDLEVCGEAEDMASALAVFDRTRPDLAIIDISLKSGNGIDLIKRFRERDESVRIVVWSMYPERLYAERALRAGAMGYVNKGSETREILQAIRTVLAGRIYLGEEVSTRLLGRVVGGGSRPIESCPIESLSDRELEVFKLMGEGLTTEKIAETMHVSPKTVETYRARVKEKLGLSNITELIQQAVRWVLDNC
jgi:DNA-binding NarL/FixJ family response regulator